MNELVFWLLMVRDVIWSSSSDGTEVEHEVVPGHMLVHELPEQPEEVHGVQQQWRSEQVHDATLHHDVHEPRGEPHVHGSTVGRNVHRCGLVQPAEELHDVHEPQHIPVHAEQGLQQLGQRYLLPS